LALVAKYRFEDKEEESSHPRCGWEGNNPSKRDRWSINNDLIVE
jgi:hypothetical protein